MTLFLSVAVGVKTDPAEKEEKADWLKQGGMSLPGCSLKKQMDILSIIDPVGSLALLHHCVLPRLLEI